MPYLFTHFKEKITPDGEQVYFGISRDGFNWEEVNGGNPILTAELGEKGCRDIEIVRLHTGGFVIITTDLCVAYRYDENKTLYQIETEDEGAELEAALRAFDEEQAEKQ